MKKIEKNKSWVQIKENEENIKEELGRMIKKKAEEWERRIREGDLKKGRMEPQNKNGKLISEKGEKRKKYENKKEEWEGKIKISKKIK